MNVATSSACGLNGAARATRVGYPSWAAFHASPRINVVAPAPNSALMYTIAPGFWTMPVEPPERRPQRLPCLFVTLPRHARCIRSPGTSGVLEESLNLVYMQILRLQVPQISVLQQLIVSEQRMFRVVQSRDVEAPCLTSQVADAERDPTDHLNAQITC